MDPEIQKQLENIRAMVKLQTETPTEEWPLVYVAEYDALLVVREWPCGKITAYTMTKSSTETP